jgi:signal transduction histidine kinase
VSVQAQLRSQHGLAHEGRSSVRALALGSFGVSVALALGMVVYLVRAWDVPILPTEFGVKGYAVAFSLVLGGVGAVLASKRPGNAIGWIFCGLSVLAGVLGFTAEYARWAVVVEGGGPPGALLAAWVQEWLWIPLVVGLGVVAALFPDGRFRSPRWRTAVEVSVGLAAVPMVLNAIIPRLTIYVGHHNPVGVHAGPWFTGLAAASGALIVPVLALGAWSAIGRFRRSHGDERQQLKWLALAIGLVAIVIGFYGFTAVVLGSALTTDPSSLKWAEYVAIASFLAVPVAIAFGVLKYRLYDIDIVINKAVVYGAIAVFITAVYVAMVVGIGAVAGRTGDTALSAAAAAVVALAFQPVRRWAQRLGNRVVYGHRATPYEVLSELSSRFAGTYSLDDALPRLARVTAEATGAESAGVWLRSESELHRAAAWPADPVERRVPLDDGALPGLDGREAWFPARHQGQLLGALSVVMPASEPLGPPQEKLLEDVAAQAGLVLRNVALVEDLRASRKRIVATQDARARALERNIHDGAQQQLVALAVKLRLADGLVGRDDAKAHDMLGQLQSDATDALENLRDLARGIYPPLLADAGLPAALEAQARKSTIAVTVEAHGVGRFSPEVEAAAYFVVLEALQNVSKYANAKAATVRVSHRDGVLTFAVADDGVGFDPQTARHGSGLQGMADRLAALGGELSVSSSAGHGAAVGGWIPAEPIG